MKSANLHTAKQLLFSGGVAEIVDHPTPLTVSFLQTWFSGLGAFGTAMRSLGLPCQSSANSILICVDGELLVDVSAEERMLYAGTVLGYGTQTDYTHMPMLSLRPVRLLSPSHVWHTMKLIGVQSGWVANPTGILTTLTKMVDSIDETKHALPFSELDTYINSEVMPAVIAVGYVAEYFHQYCMHQSGSHKNQIETYISANAALGDWIFHSMADQYLVKSGARSFDWYMERYGNRADRDFELACPRWHENPQMIRKLLDSSVQTPEATLPEITDDSLKRLADTVISIQQIRSQVKQKALVFISSLRQRIIGLVPDTDALPYATRKQLLTGTPITQSQTAITPTRVTPIASTQSGRGTPISRGRMTGTVFQVTSPQTIIPGGAIAVFPNASPEFSILFPKCAGIIFQKGGQTSHGAIVAREYGIPAIVDNTALAIPNNARLTLDGELGTWQIISD